MLARPRPILLCSALLVALLVACGGGGEPTTPAPKAIEGAYAMVLGPHATLMTLAPTKAHVVCTPKPGLKEFDLEATPDAPEDAGKYLRFALMSYSGPKDYEIEYTPGGTEHKVEVGFPAKPASAKSFKYKFFQYLRSDTNTTYRTHCDFSIQSQELPDRTKYTGTVSCSALWADFDAFDYAVQPLNGFADLIAKFECESAT
jgi:hypothetical protein